MLAYQFIAKWKKVELSERSASQQHFLDLCELVGHPKPAFDDPTGESFTFEKGAKKQDGGDGWADVWKRGFFGWEYKGRHRDLDAAYSQLVRYRESLENPPLLVVCDMNRIIVRTNFTNTITQKYEIPLLEIGSAQSQDILHAVFFEPEKLHPDVLRQAITKKAASQIAEIAQELRGRGLDPHDVARFLDRIVFCLFAEDVRLLPEGLFNRLVEKTRNDPERFEKLIGELFAAMASGGDFGLDDIRYFNGNLFNDGSVLPLKREEIALIWRASQLDWGGVDPSIFGTLFERGLDPDKRSQLGAHYTSRADIETLVEPVVMQPLRREWDEVRKRAEKKKTQQTVDKVLGAFLDRLESVKVLDPACGSGNFLYVTLQKLKDLEKEVNDYAMSRGYSAFTPKVGPWQLYGIEVNPYAYDLAQVTVWIGYLQWMRDHGYPITDNPVLRSMDNFKCMDAILDLSDPENPKEPEWPEADFIVGNPPFLGGNKIRQGLGDSYVGALFRAYHGRLSAFSDLCCYWFERARCSIEAGRCGRAGLLATQGIRGGVNRETLTRIMEKGSIFFAESDRPWILDGASVHVSMVGFDGGWELDRRLDGQPVSAIFADLNASVDVVSAGTIHQNADICVYGSQQKGSFDISPELARGFLSQPNASGRCNGDVVKPSVNAKQLLQRTAETWVIDFGVAMSLNDASRYEAPFEYVKCRVQPERSGRSEKRQRQYWWLHARPSPRFRAAITAQPRYIVTPAVAKHRVFVWLDSSVLVDHACAVFCRCDNYFFGVLHSHLHELWARAQGTQVRERESGFRYTPSTCFETYPLPEPTPEQEAAIGDAARELDELRNRWLNPPEWTKEEVLEFPGSMEGPWARYVHDPDERGIGMVRYPRLAAKDADSAQLLAKRTLTNLYNQRPTWLDLAHRKLDEAVFAAYGWDPAMTDEEILGKLLELNLARAAGEAVSG